MAKWALLGITAAFVVACGGTTNTGSTTGSPGGGQVCFQVSPDACGISNYCAPPCTSTTCYADEICRASGHCEPTPCASGFACGAGTVCDPAKSGADAHGCAPASCSSDGYACPAGYRCAAGPYADPHGCSDVSCTAGFTCPLNTDCDPSSTDLHHCKPRACTQDGDCDCGACIDAVCHARLNVCSLPPA